MIRLFVLIGLATLVSCKEASKSEIINSDETKVMSDYTQSETIKSEKAEEIIDKKKVEIAKPEIDNTKTVKPQTEHLEVIEKMDKSGQKSNNDEPEISNKKTETKTFGIESTTTSKVVPSEKTKGEENKPMPPPPTRSLPDENKGNAEIEKEDVVKSIHDDFDAILKKYVSADGKVNYNALKANQSGLNSYIEKLKKNPPSDNQSNNEKLAYWINAYNAFTIKKVIDNYPIKSIKDLDGGNPWDVKWITIGGKTLSLNNIENDIIRPTFGDARIHFAVNCAAKSCPPLLNAAYMPDRLNAQLNSQTKKFINNSSFNDLSSGRITVSKIFDWYKSDFGNLVTYINKYSNTKISEGAKIDYKDYNWSLNN